MDIQIFVNDVKLREEVQDYIVQFLQNEIISEALNGNDVKHLAEAKKIIDKSFDAMVTEFTKRHEKPFVNEME